ncbi:MAG: thioesterase family protein [Desulfobacteraceae bacterium]|jgi:YbgC/YbaW family acyl-CoA thioester hydrolase
MSSDYKFSIPLTVRAGDLNYGNHVAYYNYLLYFQEARVGYLAQFGCTEMDIKGYGMIISEARCRYKRELFLGDAIQVYCSVTELKPKRFTIHYQIQRSGAICAEGETINICYDYAAKRIASLPKEFIADIARFENLDTGR